MFYSQEAWCYESKITDSMKYSIFKYGVRNFAILISEIYAYNRK